MKKSLKRLVIPASVATGLSLFSAMGMAQDRTVFIQLFEWKWNDIAQECENVLGPKGFSAVQVSPPNKVIDGYQWWTRYQPVSYAYESNRSGSREEFQSMVKRCADAGVDIYVDAVINHMAAWDRNFPEVPYSGDDFHNGCPHQDGKIASSDYRDSAYNVQNCDLSDLDDLNTSSDYVQEKIAAYMNDGTSMGVKGFRIDAAKHIAASDLAGIFGRLDGDPFIFQEVIGSDGEAVQASEYTSLGSVTEFKYSSWISDRFRNGSLSGLSSFGSGMLDSDSAIVFTDNHDNQRGHGGGGNILTFKNGDLYKLANIYMLAWPYGYPKLMSSYAFDDTDQGPPSSSVYNGDSSDCGNGKWVCEHRWTEIINMVGFRNATNGEAVTNWWDNGNNQIAFGRGDKGFVVINRDEHNSLQQELKTGLPAGEYCDVISGDECSVTVSVDDSGNASFSVAPMSAVAVYTGGGQSDNPVAKITGAPTSVELGERVTLDGSSSSDPNGSIVSYSWSTGETTASITKTLTTEGENSFTLTVTDDEGNTGSKTVTIWAGDLPPQGNFAALNFRGTPNDWQTTAMKLIADNTWQVEVEFDGRDKQRFKFDQSTDWSANWGDGNNDGVLDQEGSSNDIYTEVVGSYLVTVNDETMAYSIQPVAGEDKAPVAKVAGPDAETVYVGDSVTLSAAGSTDDNGIESYEWSNGESGESITVTLKEAGTYSNTVTVTDSAGQSDTATVTFEVYQKELPPPADAAPVAKVSPTTTTVEVGESVKLSASDSTDDNGIVSYSWSTGETGQSISWSAQDAGPYPVTVTVTDTAGQTDSATATIVVTSPELPQPGTDEAPVAKLSPTVAAIKAGQSVTFSAAGSSDDNGIVSYLWNTGETDVNMTRIFSEAGTYTVSVTVTDSSNQHATASATVVVAPENAEQVVEAASGGSNDGGSLSIFSLLMLMGLGGLRRRR